MTVVAKGRSRSGRVCHVSDKIEGAVYIGRSMPRQRLKASPLGNPFKIGQHGDRANVLRLYALYLRSEVRRGDRAFITALIDARNKPLACWCRHHGEPLNVTENGCHGDIIIRYLDQHTDDQIREWMQAEIPPDALSGPQSDETEPKRGSDHVAGQDDRTDGEGA